MVFNQVIFCICFSQNERPLARNCNPMFIFLKCLFNMFKIQEDLKDILEDMV